MPRPCAWTTILTSAFLVLVVERSIFAAPQQGRIFELEWIAPAGCPDRADGEARVEKFLGRSPGAPEDPDVRARVRIAPSDEGFSAVIELTADGEPSRRTLETQRCEVAADGAAYVIAAVIDPTVEPPEPEPDPDVNPEPPQPDPSATRKTPAVAPSRVRIQPPRRETRRRRHRVVRGAVRIGGAIGVGVLPRVAGGIVVSAGVLLPRVRFDLGANHWFAPPARIDDRPDAGGDIDLTAAIIRACPLAVRRPVEVPVCGGLELGSMRGTGRGITEPTTTRLLWAALTASIGVVWMPSRWAGVWFDAGLQVPVSRPIFEVEGVGHVFQPSPAGFVGAIGLEARFP